MNRLVQVTDLHVKAKASDNAKVVAVLKRAKDVAAGAPVVATGDLVDYGWNDDGWKRFDEILASLAIPNFVGVPGNHDATSIIIGQGFDQQSWDKFRARFPKWKEDVEAPAGFRLDTDTDVLLLNSLVKNDAYFACGEIGDRQLKTLRTYLSGMAPGRKALVFLHHHLHDPSPFEELVDAKRLERVLLDNLDHVGFVGFGHRHSFAEYKLTAKGRTVKELSLEKTPDSGTFAEIFKKDDGDWDWRRPKKG